MKFNKLVRALAITTALVTPLSAAIAETVENRLVPFQGRLTDGAGQMVNSIEQVIFSLYDEPTGGQPLWTETHEKISIIDGQINVLLGSKTDFSDPDEKVSDDAISFEQPRYIGITVGNTSNQEMLPRQQLVPSFHSRSSDIASDAILLGGEAPSYYNYRNVMPPVGSIMAWFKDFEDISIPLPSGWVEANGQIITDKDSPFYASGGEFSVPNLNGEKRFLRGSDIAGTLQSDQFQDHKHGFTQATKTGNAGFHHLNYLPGHQNVGLGPGFGGQLQHHEHAIPAGTVGDPNSGSHGGETRPINMSVVWIMRIK